MSRVSLWPWLQLSSKAVSRGHARGGLQRPAARQPATCASRWNLQQRALLHNPLVTLCQHYSPQSNLLLAVLHGVGACKARVTAGVSMRLSRVHMKQQGHRRRTHTSAASLGTGWHASSPGKGRGQGPGKPATTPCSEAGHALAWCLWSAALTLPLSTARVLLVLLRKEGMARATHRGSRCGPHRWRTRRGWCRGRRPGGWWHR